MVTGEEILEELAARIVELDELIDNKQMEKCQQFGIVNMLKQILKEQLNDVANALEKHIPLSMTVFGLTKLIIRGYSGYKVWTDIWPEFNVIVIAPDWEMSNVVDMEKVVAVFLSGKFDLDKIFEDKRIIKERTTCTLAVDGTVLYQKCHNILTTGDHAKTRDHLSKTTVYFTNKVPQNVCLPECFSTRRLQPDDLHDVMAWLDYSQSQLEFCKSFKRLLDFGCHGIAVLNTKEELIAWAFEKIYGAIGVVFVKPMYRRQGIGRFICSFMTRDMVLRNGWCFVKIYPDNEISIALHESLGFVKREQPSFLSQYSE